MSKISLIFGTRPEAIKLCPLASQIRSRSGLEAHVCVTGQHRQMLDQVLDVFQITPDVDLALMEPNQSLATLTARAVREIDSYIAAAAPDLVIVQGDTTTAFCAAIAAFYRRIPVGHVEAGLRTWDKRAPFPEEMNRVLTSRLADYHFAPTAWAKDNLLREGVAPSQVFVTGNTVIDALLSALEKVKLAPVEIPGLNVALLQSDQPIVLITGHRRENFGEGFEAICRAVAELAVRFPEVAFVYPVHLNPNVQEPVFRLLGAHSNIHLIAPLSYLPFVALMNRAKLILTDSGGVQEEAPSLGKPVLVMRETTERPEAVDAGTVKLVGAHTSRIVNGVSELLRDDSAYARMSGASNPYGDGHACERIVDIIAGIR